MTKCFSHCIAIVVVAVLTGCSAYDKLYKSGDFDKMYNTAVDMYDAGKYEKALSLFEIVAPSYNGTARGDTMSYLVASSYYKMGDFEMSELSFDEFRRQFGRSPFIEDAEYMYAMGYYFSSPAADRDQTKTVLALQAITEYLERYPNSAKKELCEQRIEELTNKLYDKSYINAKTYYKIGRYKSAIVALGNALTEYPESPHHEELLYLLLASNYEYALNSVEDKQTDRYLDMLDSYYNLISEFPDTKYRREADRMQKTARKHLDDRNITSSNASAAETSGSDAENDSEN